MRSAMTPSRSYVNGSPIRTLPPTPSHVSRAGRDLASETTSYPDCGDYERPRLRATRDTRCTDTRRFHDRLPDPLSLEVNTTTGAVTLVNPNEDTGFEIDYYEILGSQNSLDAAGWTGLGGQPGFPEGDGSGNGWESRARPDAGFLGEVYLPRQFDCLGRRRHWTWPCLQHWQGCTRPLFNYRTGSATMEGTVTYFDGPTEDADFDSDGDVDGGGTS